MNKLKLSSKLHILIIVSCVFIAIGMAIGTICHFVAGGFFNWGADEMSFKSVTVNYGRIDYTYEQREEIKNVCDDVFSSVGVNYYSCESGATTSGAELTFKFADSTDTATLKKAVENVASAFGSSDTVIVEFHDNSAVLTGEKAITRLAIAIASIIALQFIYCAIRYRLAAAFASCLASVHNLAVFTALLAICRIPVGTFALAFALVCVLATFITCGFAFGDQRRRLKKDEAFAALSAEEQSDALASRGLIYTLLFSGVLCVAALLLFVVLSIGALSATLTVGYAFSAVAAFVACAYGTAFFIPPVYGRFKRIGDAFNKKHARVKKDKKKVKAGE